MIHSIQESPARASTWGARGRSLARDLSPPVLVRVWRRMHRRGRPPGGERVTRRRVMAGPLRGLEIQLPESGGAPGGSWADRIVEGRYEVELLEALAQSVRPGAVLFDIGAHIGVVSLAWRSLGGGESYAFEPNPENARRIEENARINRIDGIHVVRLALSSARGNGTLVLGGNSLGRASMGFVSGQGAKMFGREETTEECAIELATVDDLVSEGALPAPAVMKVDVEGAEAHVLRGAQHTLERVAPRVLAEVHTIGSALEVSEMLARLGYRRKVLREEGCTQVCWDRARGE